MGNKIIRISTENEISIHDYPAKFEELYTLIGCRTVEHIMPRRLYTELKMSSRVSGKHPGRCVSMLIDEEGLLKENPQPNLVASFLYEADKHQHPIVGNVIFVGDTYKGDGVDFCGIDDTVFYDLFRSLKTLCEKAKGIAEKEVAKSDHFADDDKMVEQPILKLTFIGWDSCDKPVYQDEKKQLFKDVDPKASRKGDICTASSFDGEPDTPIRYIERYKGYEVVYSPERMIWQEEDMKTNKAIQILDEVITRTNNKIVDIEHIRIAWAWQVVKKELADYKELGTIEELEEALYNATL